MEGGELASYVGGGVESQVDWEMSRGGDWNNSFLKRGRKG